MASKMLLVDGNSLMHRAFHALPVMTSESGEYTNALHGFLMMLLRLIADEQPDLCAVAFDLHAPTFRHLKYDAYKAGRAPTPDELRAQFRTIHDILNEMHIRIVELEGYEADDLLGTLSLKCEEKGIECLIVTGDRDAFQLAGPQTTIIYTRQGIRDIVRVTPAFVYSQWQLSPAQLIDMKGLMGDQSDNIPGVPGIGEKTALKLLDKYHSLEEVLDNAEADQKGKLRERLMQGRESALFSKWLATIDRHAPLNIEPEDCPIRALHDASPLLLRLSLRQAADRLETLDGMTGMHSVHPDIGPNCEVLSPAEFQARLPKLNHAVAAVTIGTYLCVAADTGLNVALRLGGDLIDPGLSIEEGLALLTPALKLTQQVVVYNLKHMTALGFSCDVPVVDAMLAAYVTATQKRSYTPSVLCGDLQLPYDEDFPAPAILRVYDRLRDDLNQGRLRELLKTIEQPLAAVLCRMEKAGVLTDEAALMSLSEQFTRQIDSLLAEIRQEAGEEINVNSPRQLGVLLFDKMKLPGGKKTKTGWSTTADILEALQDDYPLVAKVLEYRKYAKLKSTYVDALLRLRGADGRIHTSFDQTATVTGRISSVEPNLQNIPVRTPLGREIRRAFIAAPGHVLVDADYSQIELRVLAHMSGDEGLIDAFNKEQDIHARTAAEVYGVALEDVTREMRSSAKAVNFGIVYGISDFGLARNIGVSRAEAAAFIERYFERYPLVKRYMDDCVAAGYAQGYVETLMGRRRYLPELNDRNYATRQFGERAAMNSPIQGTAADIIKLAMIKTDEALRQEGLSARLILQVHDELIVEAPEAEAERAAQLLRDCMENIIALKVPLRVEVNTARSWYDCK